MAKNTLALQIDIKNWKDRLTNDLDLVLGSIERDAAARLPKYAAQREHTHRRRRTPLTGFFSKAVNIRLAVNSLLRVSTTRSTPRRARCRKDSTNCAKKRWTS